MNLITSNPLPNMAVELPLSPGGAREGWGVRPAWAQSCGCKSRRKLITTSEVKRNCMRATECGKETWSVNCEPMDKNQIKGAAKQGERALNREALVIKAKRRKSGGCAVKDCVLTWGDLALRLKGRQQKSWSEESAEVVVVTGGALKATSQSRRTKREGVIEPMSMSKELHQMPAEHAGQTAHVRCEAAHKPVRDESCGPRHDKPNTGSELGSPLLHAALTRENLQQAWKQVKANKGAAGVDGLDIEQTAQMIRTQWPEIRAQLLQGSYRPSPVRRVTIPKPDGGQRELGIPTVVDRLIQQALLQVLQPILDPTFSEHSYGFRPRRSAHQAVKAARAYVQSGKRVVVDVDLEKFFDTVNHDILINRLQRRIDDAGVIRLIRAYLNSAVMDGGVVLQRDKGTPQGGPLSPLLANVLLDEVDKELEKRGHSFARYADDCNVYVHSQRAGERVMALLEGMYAKLHLKVNEAKSAVASVFDCQVSGL